MFSAMNSIKIFGRDIIQDSAVAQLETCVNIINGAIGVLTPDSHLGKHHPIGGAIAYPNHLSWSGVGPDIACGNKAVKTGIKIDSEFRADLPRIMDEVFKRISFGVGRPNNEPIEHHVFDKISTAHVVEQRKFLQLAKDQLGTVGSGNHFVDLFEGQDGYLWIGVHFGSRGFGFKTAAGFLALSQNLSFSDKANEGDGNGPPVLFDARTDLGQSYLSAMELAGEYAYAGRDTVVSKVLEILGNPNVSFTVHNHHNFIWRENHFGQDYWVARKGCTPAFPNQYGFIGANMHDTSLIVQGVDSEDSKAALYSTVHGAGRRLSRTQAAGKKKWVFDETQKRKVPKIITKGLVDFNAVQSKMLESGIQLRGAGADEAPECYKKLDEVVGFMPNNIKIIDRLKPIGVAMAGSEFDPYKD